MSDKKDTMNASNATVIDADPMNAGRVPNSVVDTARSILLGEEAEATDGDQALDALLEELLNETEEDNNDELDELLENLLESEEEDESTATLDALLEQLLESDETEQDENDKILSDILNENDDDETIDAILEGIMNEGEDDEAQAAADEILSQTDTELEEEIQSILDEVEAGEDAGEEEIDALLESIVNEEENEEDVDAILEEIMNENDETEDDVDAILEGIMNDEGNGDGEPSEEEIDALLESIVNEEENEEVESEEELDALIEQVLADDDYGDVDSILEFMSDDNQSSTADPVSTNKDGVVQPGGRQNANKGNRELQGGAGSTFESIFNLKGLPRAEKRRADAFRDPNAPAMAMAEETKDQIAEAFDDAVEAKVEELDEAFTQQVENIRAAANELVKTKVQALEEEKERLVEHIRSMREENKELQKHRDVNEATRSLTVNQRSKVEELAESMDYSDSFNDQLKSICEQVDIKIGSGIDDEPIDVKDDQGVKTGMDRYVAFADHLAESQRV